MLQIRHKHHVHQLRDDQHHDGDAYGRFDVLAGVKAGSQHLDGDQADQPRAITHQGGGGLVHVPVRECPIVVQRGHQRLGKGQQGDGARHSQQHHNAQTPVQHVGVFFSIVGSLGGGQLRHQDHANRHTQHGGGELHQAVGIGQPAHAAGCEVRGNLRVDEQRDLRHADTQQRGQHQFGDVAGGGVGPSLPGDGPVEGYFGQQAQFEKGRDLHRQLQHAAQHHTSGQRVNWFYTFRFKPRRTQPSGSNHRHVQQYRRGRRHGKTPPGIEYPA